MEGRTDGQMEIPPMCPTGHQPFGTAAQKGEVKGHENLETRRSRSEKNETNTDWVGALNTFDTNTLDDRSLSKRSHFPDYDPSHTYLRMA